MRDQQHFAVLPSADLLDHVEVLVDLQPPDALSRQLHELVDQAAVHQAQLDHLDRTDPLHTSRAERSHIDGFPQQ